MAKPGRLRRILWWFLAVLLTLLLVAIGVLWWTGIPAKAAGLTAQSICAGTFVGGRPADDVAREDVIPQSWALKLVSYEVDEGSGTVRAKFLRTVSRTAAYASDRGCVLDLAPTGDRPTARPGPRRGAWPAGYETAGPEQWPAGVNADALRGVVDKAMGGAGDPAAANPRGVAVVYDGQLLAERTADGFGSDTPQLGWSMTKTVNAMLFYKIAHEHGLDLQTPVVQAFPAGREPGWVQAWRGDGRREITVDDLLHMRSGLDFEDDYGILGKVVEMLYDQPDMAAYAASQPLIHEPGTVFAYSSGVAVILSQIARARFPDDHSYWAYPRTALFEPLGVDSATMFTDTSGTWVGGSYLWADPGDWARLGQFMLNDGRWNDQQILPPGWLALAGTPPSAELAESYGGGDYSVQTWLPASPLGGECDSSQVPADTMVMSGHYGQTVAMIPSRKAVLVRLGWTIDKGEYDDCRFIADSLAALPR